MHEGQIIQGGFWDGAEVISVYTRAQALEDGFLVDVNPTAREAGFIVPVAVTREVWNAIKPNEAEEALGQSIQGRLWDVLSMARMYGRAQGGDTAYFPTMFQMRRPDEYPRRYRPTLHLKAVSGPGDDGEHVVTIMFRHES